MVNFSFIWLTKKKKEKHRSSLKSFYLVLFQVYHGKRSILYSAFKLYFEKKFYVIHCFLRYFLQVLDIIQCVLSIFWKYILTSAF